MDRWRSFLLVMFVTTGAAAAMAIGCGGDDDDDDNDNDNDALDEQLGQACENYCMMLQKCTGTFYQSFETVLECTQHCFDERHEWTEQEQCNVQCDTSGCDPWSQCVGICEEQWDQHSGPYWPE